MTTQTKPHGARYPWDDWFGLKEFTLIRGVNFAGLPHGMAQTIRQAAGSKRYDLDVEVTVLPDRVRVRVLGKHDPTVPRKKGPRPRAGVNGRRGRRASHT